MGRNGKTGKTITNMERKARKASRKKSAGQVFVPRFPTNSIQLGLVKPWQPTAGMQIAITEDICRQFPQYTEAQLWAAAQRIREAS